MPVTIKGLLLSLMGVTVLIASQVCWAYRLPYPEKKHHLPYRVDVPAKETYIKVLTPVESPDLDQLPPSPSQLYDCDNDVYDNYKHHGYLQKYVLYNEEQC